MKSRFLNSSARSEAFYSNRQMMNENNTPIWGIKPKLPFPPFFVLQLWIRLLKVYSWSFSLRMAMDSRFRFEIPQQQIWNRQQLYEPIFYQKSRLWPVHKIDRFHWRISLLQNSSSSIAWSSKVKRSAFETIELKYLWWWLQCWWQLNTSNTRITPPRNLGMYRHKLLKRSSLSCTVMW